MDVMDPLSLGGSAASKHHADYTYHSHYLSVHSEDRDMIKYPDAAAFEMMLPTQYTNVQSIRLVQWTFPSNYDTFSLDNQNITLAFALTEAYDPSTVANADVTVYESQLYAAVASLQNTTLMFHIEEGFYNPQQMVTELTNKMNFAVTQAVRAYLSAQHAAEPTEGWNATLATFNASGGYARFTVVYHYVSAHVWFGNRTDAFEIRTSAVTADQAQVQNLNCLTPRAPDFSNYGLAANLGLPREDTASTSVPRPRPGHTATVATDYDVLGDRYVPRFFYGDVEMGDDGLWLLPSTEFPESPVHWIQCPFKINLFGEAFMYLDVEPHNCVDETQPFSNNKQSQHTNLLPGRVHAALAKIPVPCTPMSQWFDRNATSAREYSPHLPRLVNLRVRLRYHNNRLVQFGVFNYSLMFEIVCARPRF